MASHYVKGKKEGETITYFGVEQGKGISKVEYYANDLLNDQQKLFYPTGELLQVTPYSHGRALAYATVYEKSGKIQSANKNKE